MEFLLGVALLWIIENSEQNETLGNKMDISFWKTRRAYAI